MVITALDTYELVKQLRAAGFTDEQAETLTMVLRKAQDVDLSHLATKDDVSALAVANKADIAALAATTKADIAALAATTKADIAALAAATKADLAETKAEIFRAMFAQTLVIIGTVVALLKIGGH
jgi:hypothetical protein